jgi:hypothetical protein
MNKAITERYEYYCSNVLSESDWHAEDELIAVYDFQLFSDLLSFLLSVQDGIVNLLYI